MTATENKVPVHDLHATILHLLGLNHEQLTYPLLGSELLAYRRGRRRGEGYFGMMDLIHPVIQSTCPERSC